MLAMSHTFRQTPIPRDSTPEWQRPTPPHPLVGQNPEFSATDRPEEPSPRATVSVAAFFPHCESQGVS